MKTLLTLFQILLSITIIISIFLQPTKNQGFTLSSTTQNNYFSKKNTIEWKLQIITIISTILFCLNSLLLFVKS